jgi:hypothetical protein
MAVARPRSGGRGEPPRDRMSLTTLPYRTGRGSVRRRRWVVGVWVALGGGIFLVGRPVGPAFLDDFRIPGAEASSA